ncbi:hypothetical protein MKX01_008198 [Papaver californicum]|nr:hypothetical protein MKX01_008198 [Papaver californicum]
MKVKSCIGLVSQSAGAANTTISLVAVLVMLLLITIISSIGAQLTGANEVNALLAVKQNLNGPRNFLKKWNKQTDPCTSNWTGVLCFNTSSADGYLHVQELQLLSMNLTGTLSSTHGRFSHLKRIDFMWNNITGSISKKSSTLKHCSFCNLLNGNRLTGSLPEELGYLSNLDRIQIDQNFISGPLPISFANLKKTKHFLLDNSNLSGPLPPKLSRLPNLLIIYDLSPSLSYIYAAYKLDSNHFDGGIPDSYSNMKKLLKMSLRNCSLTGPVPGMSRIPNLAYIDLSSNQLNGSIPSSRLSDDMTTIDLSNNRLEGVIPSSFSGLPRLQRLSLEDNSLNGSISSIIWSNMTFKMQQKNSSYFQNNSLSNISGTLSLPVNVIIRLQENPVCMNANQLNIVDFCGSLTEDNDVPEPSTKTACVCSKDKERVPAAPDPCLCAVPLKVGYRLKSPGFSDFLPYKDAFNAYLSSGLSLELYQLSVLEFECEKGPRLKMHLNLFPNLVKKFNESASCFCSQVGTLTTVTFLARHCWRSLTALVSIFIARRHEKLLSCSIKKNVHVMSKRIPIKVDGVKGFTFEEMALATNNFDSFSQVEQGGYDVGLRVHVKGNTKRSPFCKNKSTVEFCYETANIATDSAKGILYLHMEADPPIFHRDVKSRTIFIGPRFSGKVADFGLSRLAPVPDIQGTTPGHVSTVVKGTSVSIP